MKASAPLVDPREASDFDPALWPTCDGVPLPPPNNSETPAPRDSRLKLRLAAAYYAVNLEHRSLLAARQEPDRSKRATLERAALQRIELAILAKERVEAECAPHGLIPEPLIRNGVVVDLKFGKIQKPQSQPSAMSMYVQVGMPRL